MHAATFKNLRRYRYATIANVLAIAFVCYLAFNTYQNSAGSYSKEINTIFVYPKDNPAMSQFYTARHEIGHYVYFKKLSEADRKEYETLFNDSNYFITDYSKMNAVENFAEEFAFATYTNMSIDYVSPSRKNFFEKHYNKMFDINGDE